MADNGDQFGLYRLDANIAEVVRTFSVDWDTFKTAWREYAHDKINKAVGQDVPLTLCLGRMNMALSRMEDDIRRAVGEAMFDIIADIWEDEFDCFCRAHSIAGDECKTMITRARRKKDNTVERLVQKGAGKEF